MNAEWQIQMAKLAKCDRCKSRLVPFENSKSKTIYYVCPKMKDKKCEGAYMKEEIFMGELARLLRKRKIEIVIEEK